MTINLKQGGASAGLGVSPTAQPGIVSIKVTSAMCVAAKGSAIAAGDVFYLMDIPAGTVIGGVTMNQKVVATGTALTFDLGDSASADEFVDGADAKVLGFKAQGTNGLFDVRKLYTAATTMDLTIKTESSSASEWEAEVLFEYVSYQGNPRAKSAKDVA